MKWKMSDNPIGATLYDRDGKARGRLEPVQHVSREGKVMPYDPEHIPFLLVVIIDDEHEVKIGCFDTLPVAMERMEYFWKQVSSVRFDEVRP